MLLEYYGVNAIRLQVQSKIEVFLQEMLTPYEVFQTYAVLLWIYEKYVGIILVNFGILASLFICKLIICSVTKVLKI